MSSYRVGAWLFSFAAACFLVVLAWELTHGEAGAAQIAHGAIGVMCIVLAAANFRRSRDR